MTSPPRKVLNVGLIGCGEVAQVVHIPTLSFMSSWFKITYLCDVSDAALKHCAAKLPGNVKTTRSPYELSASPDVDAVIVATSDKYHATHAIAALKANKHVLVEKPMALTRQDADAIAEAERQSNGRVMVGYMRRYAAPFEDAVREIGGLKKINYARVRGRRPVHPQKNVLMGRQTSLAPTRPSSGSPPRFRRNLPTFEPKTPRTSRRGIANRLRRLMRSVATCP